MLPKKARSKHEIVARVAIHDAQWIEPKKRNRKKYSSIVARLSAKILENSVEWTNATVWYIHSANAICALSGATASKITFNHRQRVSQSVSLWMAIFSGSTKSPRTRYTKNSTASRTLFAETMKPMPPEMRHKENIYFTQKQRNKQMKKERKQKIDMIRLVCAPSACVHNSFVHANCSGGVFYCSPWTGSSVRVRQKENEQRATMKRNEYILHHFVRYICTHIRRSSFVDRVGYNFLSLSTQNISLFAYCVSLSLSLSIGSPSLPFSLSPLRSRPLEVLNNDISSK